MLQKCANPSCTVPFRSLREGKLFLAEIHPGETESPLNGSRRRVWRQEHYWLCHACSSHFTLRFDTDRGMTTVPLRVNLEPRFVSRGQEEDC